MTTVLLEVPGEVSWRAGQTQLLCCRAGLPGGLQRGRQWGLSSVTWAPIGQPACGGVWFGRGRRQGGSVFPKRLTGGPRGRGFLAQVALELDQKEGRRDTPKGPARAGV